ncbi:MAG: glutamate 5-kinase [Dehalococcoidia bacterium]
MTRQFDALSRKRVVIKLGTNLITGGKARLSRQMMAGLVDQVARLHRRGFQTILVSSGAVAAGKQRLGVRKKRRDTPYRQMMAAVGQSRLMQAYDELFTEHEIIVAQTLLTKPDFMSRLGYLNARNTLLALLAIGVVPIVNENDVVFVEELEGLTFGDNDNLSAMVANLVDADLLIILSDVAGLYDADPARNQSARLITKVDKVDRSIERLAKGLPGEGGTGGMATKLQATKLATASGTMVVIAGGKEPEVILRIIEGESVGTLFPAATSRLESRKRWMLSQTARGQIVIDPGAEKALIAGNKSLLPAGVIQVRGQFERGDVVEIVNAEGNIIATGITGYSSTDVKKIMGSRSDRIEERLGYGYGAEIVHRDNLVVP